LIQRYSLSQFFLKNPLLDGSINLCFGIEPKIKNRFQTNRVTPKILSWLYFKCAISSKDRLKLFINKGFLTDVSGFTLEISKAEIIFSLPTVEIKL